MKTDVLNKKTTGTPDFKTWHVSSKGIFCTELNVDNGSPENVVIELKSLPQSGRYITSGSEYVMRRASIFGGDYTLMCNGETIASARKPSVWSGAYVATYKGAEFQLKPKGIIRQSFRIYFRNTEIGVIKRNSVWNYGSTMKLPASSDSNFGLFLIWLATIYWKNNDAAAAASGG
jgi:hypothetical protein